MTSGSGFVVRVWPGTGIGTDWKNTGHSSKSHYLELEGVSVLPLDCRAAVRTSGRSAWSLVYPLCCRSLNTNSQFSINSSSPLFAAGLRTPDLMPRSVRLASADDRCLSLLPPQPPSRARVSAQQSRGRAPPPPRLTSPYLSPDFGLSSPAKKKEKMQHKS